jgi:hypothetical protein
MTISYSKIPPLKDGEVLVTCKYHKLNRNTCQINAHSFNCIKIGLLCGRNTIIDWVKFMIYRKHLKEIKK